MGESKGEGWRASGSEEDVGGGAGVRDVEIGQNVRVRGRRGVGYSKDVRREGGAGMGMDLEREITDSQEGTKRRRRGQTRLGSPRGESLAGGLQIARDGRRRERGNWEIHTLNVDLRGSSQFGFKASPEWFENIDRAETGRTRGISSEDGIRLVVMARSSRRECQLIEDGCTSMEKVDGVDAQTVKTELGGRPGCGKRRECGDGGGAGRVTNDHMMHQQGHSRSSTRRWYTSTLATFYTNSKWEDGIVP
ncbi:hypothetical protein FB45DRAFT_1080334 [Roridomyces roridus]|uniref:Uncharacterized protein n=1 Tax=Roridomyces roridus TaxID=1738132 RepID=A0AAD7FMP7_9AGAR|nr:hypothetical protein FB45DRAFT_1080334 [Roridomyces roridus]